MREPLMAAAMELGFKSEAEANAWLDAWLERHCPALGCRPADAEPEAVERVLRAIGAGVYI